MKSGGDVIVSAANTDLPNAPASEILLRAGSGTNNAGGSGGNLFAFAGDAAGGKQLINFHASLFIIACYFRAPIFNSLHLY